MASNAGVQGGSIRVAERPEDGVVLLASSPTRSATERKDIVKCPWRPTIVLSFASFAMGLVSMVFGTTLVHTSLFFHVSVAKMSLSLTLESIGCLVGSVLFGKIGSRLDYDFMTVTTVVLMGLTTTCAPLILGFPGFVTSIAIRGVAMGFFHPHNALYCLNVWMRHRYRDSALQVQNVFNALGATVTPFIVNTFLANIRAPEQTVYDSAVYNFSNDSDTTSPTTERNLHVSHSDIDGLDRVIYAYIVIGLVTVMCGVPAVVLFIYRGAPRPCLAKPRRRPTGHGPRENTSTALEEQPTAQQSTTATRRRRRAVVFYLVILFSVGFFSGACQLIPRSYLAAFAVKQLSWASSEAALLMSVLGGATLVGRVIGVPLSAFLPKPGRLLVGHAVLSTAGLITLLVAGILLSTPTFVTWIGATAIGLGTSTMTTLVFLILFEYRYLGIVERATVSATVSVGITIGSAMSAMLVGYLSDNWTPLCMIYLTAGVLACLLGVLGIRLAVIDRLKEMTTAPTDPDAAEK